MEWSGIHTDLEQLGPGIRRYHVHLRSYPFLGGIYYPERKTLFINLDYRPKTRYIAIVHREHPSSDIG